MNPESSTDDQVELAIGRGLAYLGRRDRTVGETRLQLKRRGFEDDVIDGAVSRLVDMGYLDDTRFCQRFTEDRRVLDGWGDSRIRHRLHELGVPREAIEAVFAGSSADELERAVAVLETRLRRPAEAEADRRRAMGLLVRRGYSPQTASDAIRAHRRSSA